MATHRWDHDNAAKSTMTNLTRRLFIFGTGAALAAPAIAQIVPKPVLVPFQQPALVPRIICDIWFRPNEPAEVTIGYGECGLIKLDVGPGSDSFRWVAGPYGEICVPPRGVLRLGVKSLMEGTPLSGGHLSMIYRLHHREGPGFIETFDFPSGERRVAAIDAACADQINHVPPV